MLIKNIKTIVGVDEDFCKIKKGEEMKNLPTIDNAWLLIEKNKIADYGKMETCPVRNEKIIDATGKMVFPSWCDSHTHLVFAGNREGEFRDRIEGLSYEEIARRGGGILNSAKRLRVTPEEDLLEQAWTRIEEVKSFGTGVVEIKSGYGLTVESELKMLRVIRKLKAISPLKIKSTFLGAHALPPEFKENRSGYIQLIVNELLPKIADEGLADYIDVFCEKVAFSPSETELIMEAGWKYNLKPKIHTNQFNCMGGIEASVKHGAISVDHLEVVNESEIEILKNSNTMATLLPSAPFFINDHYPPARKLIDAGLPVALATDFNPGSTPSGKMSFVVSLACIKMKMLPEEAINAATINGAVALELQNDFGSIARGKVANIFISKPMSSIAFLPYSFGSNLVETVILNGKVN
ncbi:MAG: imidazolonepropionase [Saprospiraceae bacterium]|jgi:imidazolonepropionase|nr:imidazolonepropionase [Saprospiraceae bacterium]MDC3253316.1 imidazolonepropionase [bacterium]MDG1435504.1 imidazolonepropionase [Saprospiraceae bacterium]MDG2418834.1 imidazolonepropionase [Saprospiraceae bacterium]